MTSRRCLAAICLIAVLQLLPVITVEAAPTRASVQSQMDKLAKQISVLDEEYNLARIELSRVEGRIRSSRSNKAAADARLAQLEKDASARAAAFYRAGSPSALLAFLFADDPAELGRRLAAVKKVKDWESGLATSLKIAGTAAEQSASDLELELRKARAIRDAIADKRSVLRASVTEQKKLLDQIAAQEAAAAAARRRAVVAKPKPVQPPVPAPEDLPSSPGARTAVQTAYAQIGKPYKWGAAGPDSFDCSGLTMYSWRKAGVSLPHSSRAQYSATRRVAREDLQPGDLVFFGSPIHHVGIYIGNGNMINAPETGEFVGIRSMNRRDYAGAGRPGL